MSGEQSPKATRDSWQLLLFQSGGIKSHCLPPQKTLLFEQESDIFFWEKPGVTDCIDSVTNPVCIWNYHHHHHHQLNTNWKIWNRTKADSFRLKRWVDDWPPLHVCVATKMLMLPPHQKSSSTNSHNAVACDISPLRPTGWELAGVGISPCSHHDSVGVVAAEPALPSCGAEVWKLTL